MKIAFAHYASPHDISGVTTWLTGLATYLCRLGIPVGVYLHHLGPIRSDNSLAADLRSAGVQVFHDTHGVDLARQAEKTLGFLNEWRPTVFLPQCLASHFAAATAAGKNGLPWVFTMHSDDPFYWSLLAATQPSRNGGHIVCVSKSIAAEAQRRQVSDRMSSVIAYGVPIPATSAMAARDRFQLVYSGRVIEEQKRASLVTDVLIRACRRNSRIHASVIGEGPARAKCERLVAAANMGGRITFSGNLPVVEVRRRLLDSHAVVLMSDYEGLPVALMEAMAAGVVPVARMIASGVPELVEDRVTGIAVTADPADAAAAISALADDATLWQACSANARDLVAQRFADSESYATWTELLTLLSSRCTAPYPIRNSCAVDAVCTSIRRQGLEKATATQSPAQRIARTLLPMAGRFRRSLTLAKLRRDAKALRRCGDVSRRLHLVLAADSRFSTQVEVVLCSVRSHLPAGVAVDATILTSDLPESSIRWNSRLPTDSLRCVSPPIQPDDVLPVRPGDHVSLATYYRLFIDRVIPEHCERVIYLDCDLVVLRNLAELIDIDLGDRTVGAVQSFSIPTLAAACGPLERLPQSRNKPYFNAGVLVINMKAWRRNDIRRTSLDFLRVFGKEIRYWDQDALNAILVDDWVPLHPRWNRTSDYWQLALTGRLPFSEDVTRSLAEPYVVHFASGSKPWTHYRHPDKAAYDRFLRHAGYGSHRFTILSALMRRLRDCSHTRSLKEHA